MVRTLDYHSYDDFSFHVKLLKDCDEVEVSIAIALDINFLSVTPVFWLFKPSYVEYVRGNCRDTLQFFTDFSCSAAWLVFVYQERVQRQAPCIVHHCLNIHLNIGGTIFTHTHYLKLQYFSLLHLFLLEFNNFWKNLDSNWIWRKYK